MSKYFRPSNSNHASWIGIRTALYAAILWLTTLWLFPVLIVRLESVIGIPHLAFVGQLPISMLLFAIAAVFNLHSAVTMVTVGRGTPLPMDCAPKLVVRGLYRCVRNPMAIGGIGMGMAVALGFGSLGIFLYVLAGGLFWNFVVRPVEENDLLDRFGEPYRYYREQVKCWVPTFGFRDPNRMEAVDSNDDDQAGT